MLDPSAVPSTHARWLVSFCQLSESGHLSDALVPCTPLRPPCHHPISSTSSSWLQAMWPVRGESRSSELWISQGHADQGSRQGEATQRSTDRTHRGDHSHRAHDDRRCEVIADHVVGANNQEHHLGDAHACHLWHNVSDPTVCQRRELANANHEEEALPRDAEHLSTPVSLVWTALRDGHRDRRGSSTGHARAGN